MFVSLVIISIPIQASISAFPAVMPTIHQMIIESINFQKKLDIPPREISFERIPQRKHLSLEQRIKIDRLIQSQA